MIQALILAAAAVLPGDGVEFFSGTFEEALESAARSQKPIFIDFYSDT